MSNWGPRSEKYTSKTVSNAFQWALLLTRVAPRAYLKASRSSSGMWRTASVASRFSVRETGSPAARSSEMNPARRSSTLALVGRSGALGDGELLGRLLDVGAVLEQDVQRVAGLLGSDRVCPEEHQGPGPVQRLGHRRMLLELETAKRAHDAHDLVRQMVGDLRHPGQHDRLLPVELRVVDVQVQAPTLEGLGQLAGVVRREEHQGQLGGGHRSQLGDRDLVVGQDLEQQGLGLHLDPVDLVDEQHDRFGGADGLEQGPGEKKVLAEDVLLQLAPRPA